MDNKSERLNGLRGDHGFAALDRRIESRRIVTLENISLGGFWGHRR